MTLSPKSQLHYSTLVLVSIPVFIWDLILDDPACSFVGYATSPNMLGILEQNLVDIGTPTTNFCPDSRMEATHSRVQIRSQAIQKSTDPQHHRPSNTNEDEAYRKPLSKLYVKNVVPDLQNKLTVVKRSPKVPRQGARLE